jgi:hypothetical protein
VADDVTLVEHGLIDAFDRAPADLVADRLRCASSSTGDVVAQIVVAFEEAAELTLGASDPGGAEGADVADVTAPLADQVERLGALLGADLELRCREGELLSQGG